MDAVGDVAPNTDGANQVGDIPVRNIWLLFLYAYGLARFRDQFKNEIEESPDLKSLIGKLLCRATEERLRHRLSAGYVRKEGVLRRVRGRIDLFQTITRQLLSKGDVACRFDMLTSDTPRNRLVRAALSRLARTPLDSAIAEKARSLSRTLGEFGISATPPSRAQLAQEQIGRNDAKDRLLVSLARAVFDLFLPSEDDGQRDMFRADSSGVDFPKLYEKAIAGFYLSEFSNTDGWRAYPSRHIEWPVDAHSKGVPAFLPGMICDLVLENRAMERRIVIDTKFMNVLTRGRNGGLRLKSANIFQVYSYLRSQETAGDSLSYEAEGMLLHPASGLDFDETVVIQGHRIRFKTIDLAAPTANVLEALRSMHVTSRIDMTITQSLFTDDRTAPQSSDLASPKNA